ncbi:MAG: flagellar biosynthesis protein FliO [Betaproteobacteria bacterium]|nr:flagellar biosynthesis protein FliO [Betaproteobacteria bacterium]NBY72602.1 flagellar biosynthesis protein FliO [Betaproteobacteria bacterium]
MLSQTLLVGIGFVVLICLLPLGIRWLQRRQLVGQPSNSMPTQIISSVAVGPQQRIVTLEVGPVHQRVCLVVGVTPQSINCLCELGPAADPLPSMPLSPAPEATRPTLADNPFTKEPK